MDGGGRFRILQRASAFGLFSPRHSKRGSGQHLSVTSSAVPCRRKRHGARDSGAGAGGVEVYQSMINSIAVRRLMPIRRKAPIGRRPAGSRRCAYCRAPSARLVAVDHHHARAAANIASVLANPMPDAAAVTAATLPSGSLPMVCLLVPRASQSGASTVRIFPTDRFADGSRRINRIRP